MSHAAWLYTTIIGDLCTQKVPADINHVGLLTAFRTPLIKFEDIVEAHPESSTNALRTKYPEIKNADVGRLFNSNIQKP